MRLDRSVRRGVATVTALTLAMPARVITAAATPQAAATRQATPAPAPAPATAKPPVATATPATSGVKPAPGAKPASTAANPAAPLDGSWPRVLDVPGGGTILVYQPQVASWDKQSHLVAFSAVSYRGPIADKPALGSIKLE